MAVEKTRNKLIEVARMLFAKNGIEETTMNDIAVASGKGRRTLYTYFKSKEDIYEAVVQYELDLMAEKMAEVAKQEMDPEDKLVALIYAHLNAIKDGVQRNGNIRAEFFRDIWRVSLIRQRFDHNEKILLTTVLSEGVEKGRFEIDDLGLMVDIIRYSVRGIEVPYIYGRIAEGMSKGMIRGVVHKIIHRSLSKQYNK
ncbi:MAG: TetR/AcrR family transcriptional regulator [Bacteroidaceae bacterium]|nr:TetR/AcrR family transcriptional regulator [Bacteroidaceae bacterium]